MSKFAVGDRVLTNGCPAIVLEVDGGYVAGYSVLVQVVQSGRSAWTNPEHLTKEKTVSEFKVNDQVYMLGHDNKPSYGTVFTIVGLSEDGGRADLRYDGNRYMSSVETKDLTPFVEVLKSKLAKQIGDEPKFRVGDKVRTVVGTVERVFDPNGYANITVRFPTTQEDGSYTRSMDDSALELVERAEPKIGSVWVCNYFKYVYVGNGRYADLGGNPTDSLYEEKEFSSPLEKVK